MGRPGTSKFKRPSFILEKSSLGDSGVLGLNQHKARGSYRIIVIPAVYPLVTLTVYSSDVFNFVHG